MHWHGWESSGFVLYSHEGASPVLLFPETHLDFDRLTLLFTLSVDDAADPCHRCFDLLLEKLCNRTVFTGGLNHQPVLPFQIPSFGLNERCLLSSRMRTMEQITWHRSFYARSGKLTIVLYAQERSSPVLPFQEPSLALKNELFFLSRV